MSARRTEGGEPGIAGRAISETSAEVEGWFESLPPVAIPDLIGLWRGEELPSGHPFDGVLDRYQWFGKEFASADAVHPLLFRDARGQLFAVEPRFLPFHLALRLGVARSGLAAAAFSRVKRLLATRRPAAHLRMMEWRGTPSATMIYNRLPIHDHFRRLDEDTVVGAMNDPGFKRPFFFLLRRISPTTVSPQSRG
ncbi:DUF4334 domain-containing protein [Rhodobacter sp. NSM]|uniref:DUF4334 domain-containing protein n=1 Tax=Rhodobacter sp. NSM TaxID=3457501 RepID=UPI003FCFDE4F